MRTYAIASGKGGVGKSTLSANLGCAMTQKGWNVLLFDADLTLANLDIMLGVKPQFTLQHVLADAKTLKEVITPSHYGVGLVAGGSAVSSIMRAGKKRIGKFLGQVAEIQEEYDALIFDLSAGLDNKVLTFCRLVDELVAVTTPDPAAILDVYALAKVTFRYRPDALIRVVVNQCENETEAKSIFAKLQAATQNFLNQDLEYGGFVRADAEAAECVRLRTPFVYAHPELPASKDVSKLAADLMHWASKSHGSHFMERMEAEGMIEATESAEAPAESEAPLPQAA